MLAAGMVLAGCSDDLEENGGGGNSELTGETGYIKIALNLPSTSGNNFRADANENDDFDDGIAAEYNVKDVILALFYGNSETTAKLKCAYSLTGTWTDDVDNDNVTRYISTVQEVLAKGENDNVYALVIVNQSGYFKVTNDMLYFDTTGNGGDETSLSGKTLGDFYTTVNVQTADMSKIASTTTDGGNFLMLNAPTSSKQATATSMEDDHTVTTLQPITVYETEAQAENNNPEDIYVERAVAKVTVSVDNSNNDDYSLTVDAPNTTYDDATITFDGWKLQTTNKKMYVIRNVYASDASTVLPATGQAWKTWDGYYVGSEINRFYGSTPNPYRVYWGVDPNYFLVVSSNEIENNFNVITPDDVNIQWNNMANTASTTIPAEYCAENTTKAQAMQTNNLTSVLLKAKFKLADSESTGINDDLFMINNTSAIYTEEQFLAVATAALTGDNALGEDESLSLKTLDGKTITSSSEVSDLLQITGGTSSSSDLTDAQEKAIFEACGSSIKYYKNGVMYYYTTLIKHFGDIPTKCDGAESLEDYEEVDHLGRYGVLRNNWYELNITSVSGPGEPEIPEQPEEPGDATHGYINATINILSWAKRQQDVEL